MPILHPHIEKFLHLLDFPRFFDIIVNIIGTADFTCPTILSVFLRIVLMVEWFVRMSNVYHLFALLHSLNFFFYLCFHRYHLALLSSTSYSASLLHLLPDILGLILYSIQFCTVKYTEVQLLVKDALLWHCMPEMWTNLHDWICQHMFLSLKVQNLKVSI